MARVARVCSRCRATSLAAFLRLIFDHLLCPAMHRIWNWNTDGGKGKGLGLVDDTTACPETAYCMTKETFAAGVIPHVVAAGTNNEELGRQ